MHKKLVWKRKKTSHRLRGGVDLWGRLTRRRLSKAEPGGRRSSESRSRSFSEGNSGRRRRAQVGSRSSAASSHKNTVLWIGIGKSLVSYTNAVPLVLWTH